MRESTKVTFTKKIKSVLMSAYSDQLIPKQNILFGVIALIGFVQEEELPDASPFGHIARQVALAT